MKIGKISESVLKRSVFKQIRHRREEVLVTPGVGKDCSIIKLEPDEVMVLSTDPITGTANQIGKLAVNITANDIAASGAEMIGIMLTILLPEKLREIKLREMMQEIEECCKAFNIEVIGGHTEVCAAVSQPIITVTGVGKIKKEEITTTAGLKPGHELVMTKWAGLEGTAILANDKEEELLTRYNRDFIAGAKDMIQYISVVKDAKIVEKKPLRLPKQIRNVIRCKNPRCITSIEQELDQVFILTDKEKEIYRCMYCEEKYRGKRNK